MLCLLWPFTYQNVKSNQDQKKKKKRLLLLQYHTQIIFADNKAGKSN